MPISLLLSCRDHELAAGLCSTVVQAGNGQITGEPAPMIELLHKAAVKPPDVLLLEHSAAEERKLWPLLARLRGVCAGSRVLLLCNAYTHLKVIGFVQRGVDGCLLKTSEPALIARAVIAVQGGETWFARTALLEALRSRIASDPATTSAVSEETELLTQREREILVLIGNAMTNKEIARRLKISDHTVKTHLHRIYVKLHQSGRYKAFVSNVTSLAAEYPGAGSGGPAQ